MNLRNKQKPEQLIYLTRLCLIINLVILKLGNTLVNSRTLEKFEEKEQQATVEDLHLTRADLKLIKRFGIEKDQMIVKGKI